MARRPVSYWPASLWPSGVTRKVRRPIRGAYANEGGRCRGGERRRRRAPPCGHSGRCSGAGPGVALGVARRRQRRFGGNKRDNGAAGGTPAIPRFVKGFGGKENGAVVLPRKGEELRGALPWGLCSERWL